MKREKLGAGAVLRPLALALGIVLALLLFRTAVTGLDSGAGEESKRQLEEAVRRGCVACYAAEGVYPPDIQYLQDRYGLQVDQDRFVIYYDIFAGNLMPDITVLERKP